MPYVLRRKRNINHEVAHATPSWEIRIYTGSWMERLLNYLVKLSMEVTWKVNQRGSMRVVGECM